MAQETEPIAVKVRDGWIQCPVCRRNKRLLRITASTCATALPVYCRDCKHEIIVDIEGLEATYRAPRG